MGGIVKGDDEQKFTLHHEGREITVKLTRDDLRLSNEVIFRKMIDPQIDMLRTMLAGKPVWTP